jgi:hypothetical protein
MKITKVDGWRIADPQGTEHVTLHLLRYADKAFLEHVDPDWVVFHTIDGDVRYAITGWDAETKALVCELYRDDRTCIR